LQIKLLLNLLVKLEGVWHGVCSTRQRAIIGSKLRLLNLLLDLAFGLQLV
jgi:hypothetical protein